MFTYLLTYLLNRLSTAIIWYHGGGVEGDRHEVIVNGRRQGITKKDIHRPQARFASLPVHNFPSASFTSYKRLPLLKNNYVHGF